MGWKDLFSLKYGALATLVLQNTFLVVFMRYSRIVEGPKYASSTAVVCMEVLKFVSCLCVLLYERNFNFQQTIADLKTDVFGRPDECLKIAVPSLIYTIQNNLLYFALSHLDTPTFQVGYQVKILTTALFSVTMLGKSLSKIQWISLVLLTLGVAMAQISATSAKDEGQNTWSGFVAVLMAACTSGFAGVYFEKILKGSTTSLWMRNVQMGCSSVLLGVVSIYWSGDGESVMSNGFFYGYSPLVWTVVILQAIGGLVVAVVVKYADNILKGFAASFSIITSCILCIFFFDFKPTFLFVTGAVLVNYSMYLYSYTPSAREREKSELYSTSNKVDKDAPDKIEKDNRV